MTTVLSFPQRAESQLRRRYPIRIEGVARWLLAPLGVNRDGAYVEVGRRALRFRLAPLFDLFALRSEIVGCAPISWPMLGGSGWLLLPRRRIGLIGARRGVIEVHLAKARRIHVGPVPWTCERIAVSLEDPAGFLSYLRATELETPAELAIDPPARYRTTASTR